MAEVHRLSAQHIHHQKPFRQCQHVFNGIRQTPFNACLHHQTVYHDFDVMLYVLIQFNFLGQFIQIAVNPYTHITASLRPVKYFRVFALSSAHHRSQKLDPCPFRHRHNLVRHLVYRLLTYLAPAGRTVGNTDPRIQQTEIIVDFRYRPNRGAWIAVGGFLVDGYRRRQPFDFLHIGLFHLAQKLPCIRRQGFHVSPLPFRINRIKCQRGFTGT